MRLIEEIEFSHPVISNLADGAANDNTFEHKILRNESILEEGPNLLKVTRNLFISDLKDVSTEHCVNNDLKTLGNWAHPKFKTKI